MKSKQAIHNRTNHYCVVSIGRVSGELYDRECYLLKPNDLIVVDAMTVNTIFGGAFYFNTYREADNYRRYCLGL